MPLAKPKAKAEDIIRELDLTQTEFDGVDDSDSAPLSDRVEKTVRRASIRVQKAVGSNYASNDALTEAAISDAEFALTCAFMLRQRLNILNGRPEEAPPPEHIHPELIGDQIEEYMGDFREMIAPFQTEDFDKPGTGFAFGSRGVDETEADVGDYDYKETDYGDLPSD